MFSYYIFKQQYSKLFPLKNLHTFLVSFLLLAITEHKCIQYKILNIKNHKKQTNMVSGLQLLMQFIFYSTLIIFEYSFTLGCYETRNKCKRLVKFLTAAAKSRTLKLFWKICTLFKSHISNMSIFINNTFHIESVNFLYELQQCSPLTEQLNAGRGYSKANLSSTVLWYQ